MIKYILVASLSCILATFLMPHLINIAKKKGFTDKPTKRKNHKEPIPLIGGVGIFIGFFTVYFLVVTEKQKIHNIGTIFIAALMVLVIGFVDDYYKTRGKEFPIMPRVIVQLVAASLVFSKGIVFSKMTNPFNGSFIDFPVPVQYILTITWIFGVVTVINWSDGMDGLAGSITVISGSTMFVVALAKAQTSSALLSICLVGAILGFLRFNRHPAKVFMGDSGANFLGFMLAIIALEGAFKQATTISIIIPFLALGVPIFDNIFVIFKRYKSGKPVYEADRSQIHFRLQEKGMTTSQIVSYICLLSGCLSLLSFLILMIKL